MFIPSVTVRVEPITVNVISEWPPIRRERAGMVPTSRSLISLSTGTAFAEAKLQGQIGTSLGVVGGDHRVIGRQAPLGAVLVGGHVVGGVEMPLEHLQLLPVLKADDVVRCDGLLDRHGGLEIGNGFGLCGRIDHSLQRLLDGGNHAGEIVDGDIVSGDKGRHNLGRQLRDKGFAHHALQGWGYLEQRLTTNCHCHQGWDHGSKQAAQTFGRPCF